MTSLLISRKVLREMMPVVMGVVESLEVEMERTRQVETDGVYSGEPGFGFNRARYYVVSDKERWGDTFFSTLFAWNI